MRIDNIELRNYKIYRGTNSVNFSSNDEKNITIISGKNGYGKTTLLTSLVWCLYGKVMGEVDQKYKSQILDHGGYKNYSASCMNRSIENDFHELRTKLFSDLESANQHEKKKLKEQLHEISTFSVAITLSNLFIPSLQCENLIISRTSNYITGKETVQVLVDGSKNELTEQVGSEIFINDFVLPREIAKFFFFDAEKIVSIAELQSSDEKRLLSNAYTEVLGIKKYSDLKDQLENMRSRLRQKNVRKGDKAKLKKYKSEKEKIGKLIHFHEDEIVRLINELQTKRQSSDSLQEKLIREGSSMSLAHLKELKKQKAFIQSELKSTQSEMKELLELAPFALASNSLELLKKQVDLEEDHKTREVSSTYLENKTTSIKRKLKREKKKYKLNDKAIIHVMEVINSQFSISKSDSGFQFILNYTDDEVKAFYQLYHNIHGDYKSRHKSLSEKLKKQQSRLSSTMSKIRKGESKDSDPVVQKIRKKKITLDTEIANVENELINQKAEVLHFQNQLTSINKVLSELEKNVSVEKSDLKKDKTATKLIEQLTDFIFKLKMKKKEALEEKLLTQLNALLHKSNFVNKVRVVIEGDLIEFELLDDKGVEINKEELSMGERQLYATALLKALIDESQIDFPLFIDSPLQKLDEQHTSNLIQDFYPQASNQVVLFPLLETELSSSQYKQLLPHIASAYLIENNGGSTFKKVNSRQLYTEYRKQVQHV